MYVFNHKRKINNLIYKLRGGVRLKIKLVLLLIVVGVIVLWFYPFGQKKELSHVEFIQKLVIDLNEQKQPLAKKSGAEYLAVDRYPIIVFKLTLLNFEKNTVKGMQSIEELACPDIASWAESLNYYGKQKRKEYFEKYKSDQLRVSLQVFNKYDKEIFNENIILSDCPNFNEYLEE